jgi:sec-independent protein translocase protein TatA
MNMEALVILGMFGPTEIIIIVLIVVLLFGGRKIPELMKGIGQGMKEFKKATKDEPKKDNNNPEAELEK